MEALSSPSISRAPMGGGHDFRIPKTIACRWQVQRQYTIVRLPEIHFTPSGFFLKIFDHLCVFCLCLFLAFFFFFFCESSHYEKANNKKNKNKKKKKKKKKKTTTTKNKKKTKKKKTKKKPHKNNSLQTGRTNTLLWRTFFLSLSREKSVKSIM